MNVVAYILIALGGLVALVNWSTPVLSWRKKGFVSPIPFVGSLLLLFGLLLLPGTRPYAWIALFVDFSTLTFLIALPVIVYQCWPTSRLNLQHCFVANANKRSLTIKLFKRHKATISANFTVLGDDKSEQVMTLGLVGEWTTTKNGFSITGYAANRKLLINKHHDNYITSELNYSSDKYDGLGGFEVLKRM
ncbi:MAG: hypothetical protein JNJ77_03985 [Planctomycetia bacterium]|nr:hypothetical protein [Planctomycetia bacterium]